MFNIVEILLMARFGRHHVAAVPLAFILLLLTVQIATSTNLCQRSASQSQTKFKILLVVTNSFFPVLLTGYISISNFAHPTKKGSLTSIFCVSETWKTLD